MAYSESWSRYCTTAGPSYTYSANNCVTRAHYNYSNNVYYYYTSGCTDYGYNDHKNSGCINHSDNGYDDASYCSDHTDTGYNYYDTTGCGDCDHTDTGCNHTSGCNDHRDHGYDDRVNTGCKDHTDSPCTEQQTGYSCSTISCIVAGYTNSCSVSWSYTNYANVATKYNTGLPISLTWNHPALSTTGNVKDIDDPKIYQEVLTELKSKINTLVENKGRNKVSKNTLTINSTEPKSADYNSLRGTLESLFQDLKQESTTVATMPADERILGTNISDFKNQLDTLAGATITYTNYVNNSTACTEGSTNSTYIDSISYTDTGSSQAPSTATKSGTAYARYIDYSTYLDNPKYS